MTTPHKNQPDYASPYARNVQQYPSQSEDYLTFNVGGSVPKSHAKIKGDFQQKGQRYSSTPAKHFYYDNSGSGNNNRGGGSAYKQQQNRFHNNRGRNSYGGFEARENAVGQMGFRNNYQRQRQWNDGGGGTNSGKNFSKQNKTSNGKNADNFANYFHPTMLEDPWKDLMERYNAIRNSELHLDESAAAEAIEHNAAIDDNEDDGAESESSTEVQPVENDVAGVKPKDTVDEQVLTDTEAEGNQSK